MEHPGLLPTPVAHGKRIHAVKQVIAGEHLHKQIRMPGVFIQVQQCCRIWGDRHQPGCRHRGGGCPGKTGIHHLAAEIGWFRIRRQMSDKPVVKMQKIKRGR